MFANCMCRLSSPKLDTAVLRAPAGLAFNRLTYIPPNSSVPLRRPNMTTESHRRTRFPTPGQIANRETRQENVDAKRQTQFPRGIRIQKLLPELNESPIESKAEEGKARQILSRHVKVYPPDATQTRPLPEMKIKKSQRYQLSGLHTQSPWDTYKVDWKPTLEPELDLTEVKEMIDEFVAKLENYQGRRGRWAKSEARPLLRTSVHGRVKTKQAAKTGLEVGATGDEEVDFATRTTPL